MTFRPMRYAIVVSAALGACERGSTATDTPTDTDPADTAQDTDPGSGDTDLGVDTDTSQPDPDARVRFAHAADAPAVSVWVQGSDTPLVSSLAVGQVSGWLDVVSGSYSIELKAAGASASDAALVTLPETSVPANADLTAVAVGVSGTIDASAALRVVTAQGAVGGGAGVGLRIVHGVTDLDEVDITVGELGELGDDLLPLGRFGVQAEPYIDLDADLPVSASVLVGGERAASFTIPGLADGSGWLVVASGRSGLHPRAVGSLRAYAFSDDGSAVTIAPDPGLYLLHAVAGGGDVDLYDGERLLAGDVAYRELRRIWLPAGISVVDAFPAGTGGERPSGDPAFTGQAVDLAAGERYLLMANGMAGGVMRPPDVVALRDTFSLADPNGQARFVHAHVDLTAIDGGFVTNPGSSTFIPPLLFTDVAFASTSAVISNSGGPGPDMGIAPTGTNSAQLTFPFQFTNGRRSMHIVTGRLADTPSSEVWRVDTNLNPWMLTVRPVTATQ